MTRDADFWVGSLSMTVALAATDPEPQPLLRSALREFLKDRLGRVPVWPRSQIEAWHATRTRARPPAAPSRPGADDVPPSLLGPCGVAMMMKRWLVPLASPTLSRLETLRNHSVA